ncbi:oxidoreductase [Pedobacter duraquae]|uniref:NAD(P)-dependent dehydrogenase (Short-subunit alcohol dehydrogenase family) n=1 Tax=Pedobacter duraquae TaxID=425511 RepID=A0A4R6ILS4_9SPHI|nr:oxidoreductase [Pedobacter duraquae]TDO22916.1 NAD(P)-dependent dehydrogenase (short-subunit alcohol dehydrogenase family) [Pedobacter duraquae]
MWTKDNMPALTGKTVIITGANAGIGYETALACYQKGADVILACRNLQSANDAIANLQLEKGSGTLKARAMDLSDLTSVKQFAIEYLRDHASLNLLINNAGVMIPPAGKTTEGYELQFGVNFLGHFTLTGLLYPLLRHTPESRIVTLTSGAYLNGTIDFDNLKLEKAYVPEREYAQSKLADLLFSLELQRRIEKTGDAVLSVAAHPGAVETELARYMTKESYTAALERFGALMLPAQGALTSLYAATASDVIGGTYYAPDQDGIRGYPVKTAIAPHATDQLVAEKLWNLAEAITGIQFPMR